MQLNKLIINLCPTGMIPQKETCPHVPLKPKEIALDVKRCYELGVSMVHIHARDKDAKPTWSADIYSEIINEVRHVAPDMIIVASTSGRNWSELDKRSAVLYATPKPEMASLTLGSMNFPDEVSKNSMGTIESLNEIMVKQGIVPELEIFNAGMINYANYLIERVILKPPYYFNLILGSLGSVSLSSLNIASMIHSLPQNACWALGGIGRFQTRANSISIALGGHIRIGLEDNPYYNWHTREDASNPRLVERMIRISKELNREVASPSEARKIIGLNTVNPRL